MSTLASDSSLDSQRSCSNCNSRMSSLSYDRHKICFTCCGQDCDFENKCIECSLWSNDVFEKYLKHHKSLIAKAKSNKSRKDTSGKPQCKSSISQVRGIRA